MMKCFAYRNFNWAVVTGAFRQLVLSLRRGVVTSHTPPQPSLLESTHTCCG